MRSLWFFVNVLRLLALKYIHGAVAVDVVSMATAQTTVAFQPTPVVQVCGGKLYEKGNITTPGYPNNFPPYTSCSWTITAAYGSEILLEFIDFALDKLNSYLDIWDPVFEDGFFLSGTDSNMTSLRFSSWISVDFRSYSFATSRGFSLRFKSVALQNSTSSSYISNKFTGCGSNLTNQGNFTSPNYPAQYPNNAYCTWNITAAPGKVLQLFCLSFDLENNYDSIFVSSQVNNKTTVIYNRLSGNSSNCSWILDANATVLFTSDATVRRQGFVLGYRSVVPSPVSRTPFTQCGGNISGSGTISSPNYPGSYASNSRCVWRLRASSGQIIRLWFNSLDLEDEYDTVVVYDSEDITAESAIIYSYWMESMYMKEFSSEIVIVFTSDESVERPGFQLDFISEYSSDYIGTTAAPYAVTKYSTAISSTSMTSGITSKPSTMLSTTQKTTTTTAPTTVITTKSTTKLTPSTTSAPSQTCGGVLYSAGVFSSPNYPANYPINAICNWTLVASPGRVVLINFQNFALEGGADSLRIYNGTEISWKTPFISYSGFSVPQQQLLTEIVSVVFMSDDLITFKGFKANFTSVPSRGPNNTTYSSTATPSVCGGVLQSSGEIMSPNFPYAYPNDVSCVWTFSVKSGGAYRFEFLNLTTEEFWDYVVIRTGAVETTRVSGSQIPATVVIVSNGSISFTSDESVQNSGFRIRYSGLTSVTTSRTTVKPTTSSLGACGVAVTDLKAQNARISGGYDAPAASAPWHVQISRGSKKFGGVLLNSRWVLTAASNLKYAQASTYNLVFGKQRLNVQNVGQLSASAVAIVKYPGYNATTGDGDIALLKIGTSVSFTTKIRPICLPKDTVQAGQVCYATGYGNDAVGALKVARVTIIERQSCVNYVTLFSKNQICGGYIGGGEDVCQGDTGGPLVYFKNGRYELQGVTSQSSCGKPFSPSIFTAVAPSNSWINSVAF